MPCFRTRQGEVWKKQSTDLECDRTNWLTDTFSLLMEYSTGFLHHRHVGVLTSGPYGRLLSKVLDSKSPTIKFNHFTPPAWSFYPIIQGLCPSFYGTSWILKSCTFQVQTLIIPSSSGLIFSDLTKLLHSCRLYSCGRTPGDKKRITLDREINRKQFSFPI